MGLKFYIGQHLYLLVSSLGANRENAKHALEEQEDLDELIKLMYSFVSNVMQCFNKKERMCITTSPLNVV
jgi:hypothetical protein